MKKSKSIYFFFPEIKEFYFGKDMFLILKYLNREGYQTNLVTYKKYQNEKYPKWINTIFIKNIGNIGGIRYMNFGFFIFIIKHAKNIDVLYFFHNYLTGLYGRIYKLLNKEGIIYAKSDFDEYKIKKDGFNLFFFGRYNPLTILGRMREKICIHFADIISVEQLAVKVGLQKKLKKKEKIIYIPNGVDDIYLKENKINVKSFDQKENIIITVGRIGTEQKNNELLIDSFISLHKTIRDKWKIYLIGPYEKNFKKYIDKIYIKEPILRKKIFLIGNINNKKTLYDYYNKAKVFCLTSIREGFPNIYPEALYFGNYILTTKVSGAIEITKNNKIGEIVEHNENYGKQLETILQDEKKKSENYKKAIKESQKQFIRSSLIKILTDKLNKHEA